MSMMIPLCCICEPTPPVQFNTCSIPVSRFYSVAASPPLEGEYTNPPEWDPNFPWQYIDNPGRFTREFPKIWAVNWQTLGDDVTGGYERALIAPLRFTLNYPTTEGETWARPVLNPHPPILQDEDEHLTAGAGGDGQYFGKGGRFGLGSHLLDGSPLSALPGPIFSGIVGRHFKSTGMSILGDQRGASIRGRIRHIGVNGVIYDTVPNPELWGPLTTDPYQFYIRFLSKDWGDWRADLGSAPYLEGTELNFDVWIEIYGAYRFSIPFIEPWIAQYPESQVSMSLLMDPAAFNPDSDDFELIFTGGQTPTGGEEKIRFSDMSAVTIGYCYLQGDFNWPAPFDDRPMRAIFSWAGEVMNIRLMIAQFLNEDLEIEGLRHTVFIPVEQPSDEEAPSLALHKWADFGLPFGGSTDKWYYKYNQALPWDMSGSNSFIRSHDIQSQLTDAGWTSPPTPTSVWPTEVSVRKVSQ